MLKTLFYVRYLGKDGGISLSNGNVYSVVEKEPLDGDLYRIVDETDGDYLFSLDNFQVLKDDEVTEDERITAERRVDECNKQIAKYGRWNF